MKLAVTGAKGFVGNKLMQFYPDAQALPSLRGLSVAEIEKIIKVSDADVIVHTAAISDIGTCQADPEASWQANVLLPVAIARSCDGKKLICFSSDQVYSGSSAPGPYTEDMVSPGNLYAEEKLEMERRVLALQPDAVMLRAEWMYDYFSPKGNFFKNILSAEESISFSSQQFRGVTYVREVAEAIPAVASLPGGAYNFGSETDASIHAIAEALASYVGKKITIKDCPPHHNLWMDCSKATALGVCFSSVLGGLKRCADDYRLHAE